MMNSRDVLLIYPWYSYPRKSPPLGLAYLAAYIRQYGFDPAILDFNINRMDDGSFRKLLLSKPWLAVGISFMTNQFCEVRRLSEVIKDTIPGTLVVGGGPHPSSIPERTLQELPALDAVVKGEGELTFFELLGALSKGASCDSIRGLCFRKRDTVVSNEKRELIADLDSIPFPAWEYLDITKYNVFNLQGREKNPAFALLSSRGCPNFCTFCDSHTIFERKFRPRSAGNIFKEIVYLKEKYGMAEFDFVDDLITMQKDRVLELCKMLKASGISFKWMANSRVNTVDRQMLQAMKDAGCIRVDFGVETGDPRVRTLMKKTITDDQVRTAHKLAREIGITTGTFTMVGNLGETADSAKMTVELLKEIGDDVMVSIACPFPGTELYRVARQKGLINTEDWSRYVTSPTYSPDFIPVMRTEYLSESEILKSFYYIHSFFAGRKFQRRFGRFYLLNPRFYREWVFESKGLKNRCRMALNLVKSRMK